jgi:outer membrane lipoprotein-sorting protein
VSVPDRRIPRARGARLWGLLAALVVTWTTVTAAGSGTQLTAQQIVDRHVAARGGAQAWRAIGTMAWTGHIESDAVGTARVPFLMLFKRPNSARFEILLQNQKSVRIFDGNQGWKLRPTGQGVPEPQAYTAEEVRAARDASGLDGPLFDYQAKGVTVALQGTDTVEGRATYRLLVTLPSGESRIDWIDAQNFLQLKYERAARNGGGRVGTVAVFFRDYRTVQGFVMPFSIETGNAAQDNADRMVIEKIAFNPALDDSWFARPALPRHRNGVLIDAQRPTALPQGAGWHGAADPATPPAPAR